MIVFLFKKENDFAVRIRNLFKLERLGLGFMALVGRGFLWRRPRHFHCERGFIGDLKFEWFWGVRRCVNGTDSRLMD
jgi:hypothetical protein